jgi:hypothetical protein
MHVVRVERGIKVLIADCVSFLPVCSFEVRLGDGCRKRGSGKVVDLPAGKFLEPERKLRRCGCRE